MNRFALLLLISPSILLAVDDPILDELNKAKQDHSRTVAKIRQNLLEDIDKIIQQTNDKGGGIDYMLRERKGFVENGTPPLLPKLKGVSENYTTAKQAYDAKLEAAYKDTIDGLLKAGKLDQLATLKTELKKFRDSRPKPGEEASSTSVMEKPKVGKSATPQDPLVKPKLPETVKKDDDALEQIIEEAKKKFDSKTKAFHLKVEEAFKLREEKIRNSKNVSKSSLDGFKVERTLFVEHSDLPIWLSPALAQEHRVLSEELESTYLRVIKACLKTKQDARAEEFETKLNDLWATKWTHIELGDAKIKEGYLRLGPDSTISTKKTHTGPIEIAVVAKTENENIRITAYNGSVLIFNWEVNKKELRVCRPDGTTDKLESGSVLGVNVAPLEPNRWYSLKWQIHAKGMAVYCDNRLIWSEKKPYDVENMKANISVHSVRSVVDVKEMKVRQLFNTD